MENVSRHFINRTLSNTVITHQTNIKSVILCSAIYRRQTEPLTTTIRYITQYYITF